jgi:hypothetical protein
MRKILFFRSDLKSVEKIPLRIVKGTPRGSRARAQILNKNGATCEL